MSTWQRNNAQRPEHLHPAQDLLPIPGRLEFAQIWETDAHRTRQAICGDRR